MVERMIITAMGKQTIRERLHDVVLRELLNLSLGASDEKRAAFVVSGLMGCGKLETFADNPNVN